MKPKIGDKVRTRNFDEINSMHVTTPDGLHINFPSTMRTYCGKFAVITKVCKAFGTEPPSYQLNISGDKAWFAHEFILLPKYPKNFVSLDI